MDGSILGPVPHGIATRYVSGVSWEVPGLGRVFGGTVSPVHHEPNAVAEVKLIISTHDVLMCDFNATQRQLQCSGVLDGLSRVVVHSPPSYAPPIPERRRRGRITLPAYDAILAHGGRLSVRPAPIALTSALSLPVLPAWVDDSNPRALIQDRGLPSDHAPVSATVYATDERAKALCLTFNVADPCFWGVRYPSALDGFDATPDGEETRVRRWLRVLEDWTARVSSSMDYTHAVVALQEVPDGAERRARACLAERRFVVVSERMHCSTDPEEGARLDPGGASWVMLAVRELGN